MARKKKIEFKLNPEWMFKEPIDFEYNKYTLLDYLQKCEKNFDQLRIYPDFVELSLHIANNQSLARENVLLLTDKKFDNCDDEILLKELYPKKPRDISEEEKSELNKTLKFSNLKLYDAFNIAKSIWTIAFDNIDVSLKKNKEKKLVGSGFIYFHNKFQNKIYVWQFTLSKNKQGFLNFKTPLKKIYEGEPNETDNFNSIIENNTTWKNLELIKRLPTFEVKTYQDLPMDETVLPIVKRKILSIIFQSKQKV